MEKKKWFGTVCLCILFNFCICLFLGVAKEREINGWLYNTTERILEAENSQEERDILRKYGVEKKDFHPVSVAGRSCFCRFGKRDFSICSQYI